MIRKEIKSFILSADGYSQISCQAPTTLYSVLIENGYIKSAVENIDGELVPACVPASCTFVAKIDFSEAEAKKARIYLRLKRIMARYEVVFNGRSYGIVNNANSGSDFDVTDKIREGENVLEIRCTESFSRRNYVKADGNVFEGFVTAPKVPDIGILEIPEILLSDSPMISDVKTEQLFESEKVNLLVKTKTLGTADDMRVVASLVSPSGKIYFGGACESGVMISIPDPELWWPNGYGSPMLYKLSVTLYVGGEPRDTYESKIGLRKLEFINDENDVPWLHVNGKRIFPRGAAYLASKTILTDVTDDYLEKSVKLAVSMNFNTLSVFDEGVCLPESFYDFCDRYGIMVWQSLSIPYVAPPAAGVFASGLYDAIDDTVAQLSEHASVAVAFLAVTESNLGVMRLFPDAVDEFRSVCLKIISPILDKITNYLFEVDFGKMLSFDERYIPVLNNDSLYTASIPSEFTLREFLDDEEYNLLSKTAEAHTAGRGRCQDMLSKTFDEMRFPNGMSELVYSTQVAAAYAASKSIRRARCEELRARSAIFRQFNDGAYLISPAIVDHSFRAKAACYKISKAYAQTISSVLVDKKEINVYVRNDSKKNYDGKLLVALYDTNNKCWFETTKLVSVPPASSSLVVEEDLAKYLDAPESYYLIYELFTENRITDSGTERFVPLKHFKFRDPKIKAEISGMGRSFTVKLTAASYVAAAEISFDGVEAVFDDNYVDIINTAPTVINFKVDSAISPEELQSRIVIRTPMGCGK